MSSFALETKTSYDGDDGDRRRISRRHRHRRLSRRRCHRLRLRPKRRTTATTAMGDDDDGGGNGDNGSDNGGDGDDDVDGVVDGVDGDDNVDGSDRHHHLIHFFRGEYGFPDLLRARGRVWELEVAPRPGLRPRARPLCLRQ